MYRTTAESIVPEACPVLSGTGAPAYLADESRFSAPSVEWIAFPESVAQLAFLLRQNQERGIACVLSGGRTGVAGAVAPVDARMVISLERMNRLLAFGQDESGFFLRCQPGLTLASLNAQLSERCLDTSGMSESGKAFVAAYARREIPQLWLPVNPTESGAQIGGMAATNASGSRTYRYGSVRDWIRAITVILPGGLALRLRRGGCRFMPDTGGRQRVELVIPHGQRQKIFLPEISMPQTKCTCGYFCRPGMDLLDLFIGSEGTLGAIAEVELRLEPKPPAAAGVLVFCPTEEQALEVVAVARQELSCAALEYFDRDALQLVRDSFPGRLNLRYWDSFGVYLEYRGEEEGASYFCAKINAILSKLALDPERTWAEDRSAGCERQRELRHAIPEAVNQLIARRKTSIPELHKVGTDMAVPADYFSGIMKTYRAGLSYNSLQSVVFGHAGDGHVHVNILPQTLAELQIAKELYSAWAAEVVKLGGAVAAEHGIGRLKKPLLKMQYSSKTIESLQQLRYSFDPVGILSPGVLF